MANIGKIKKNQQAQFQNKVTKIAKYIDGIEVNTNVDFAYYNGIEHALSILEDRSANYKDFHKLTFRQWFKQLFASTNKRLK
ncbi:hypothetical protein [Psychrobacillus sp. L3]|uniref:hypothetical protein n=1 Tax=Psychrobacillus sp. L3 TaxID=3236891 RepID=UPI0036F20BC2